MRTALPDAEAEAEADADADADADMGGVGSSGNTRHANMLNSSSSSSGSGRSRSSSCPEWRMESGVWSVESGEWKTPLKLIMLLKSMTDYDDDCAQDLDLVFSFCVRFLFLVFGFSRLGYAFAVRDKFQVFFLVC